LGGPSLFCPSSLLVDHQNREDIVAQPGSGVIVGFDCHSNTHVAAVLDPLGQLLTTEVFHVSAAGYKRIERWLASFGPILAVGIESSGSYGAGLSRALNGAGVRVLEVNRPHRHMRARRGKNDFIDAEAAARMVLSGEAAGAAKESRGLVEAVRQLSVARDGAVKARTAALGQLGDLLITAPARIREQLSSHKTAAGRAAACNRMRIAHGDAQDPGIAAKVALKSVARRISELSNEISRLDVLLQDLVATAAPRTVGRLGLGTNTTAALLVAAGENIDRFSSEAAFARLCGAAPVPASSGNTQRHRLSWSGNRRANQALHMAAVVRLRYCARSRAYLQRRVGEGKTKKEVLRCLKRYIAREVFRTLRADLATLPTRT